jgi:hypothetical protein
MHDFDPDGSECWPSRGAATMTARWLRQIAVIAAAIQLLSFWLNRLLAAWASGRRDYRHSLISVGRLGSHTGIDIGGRL